MRDLATALAFSAVFLCAQAAPAEPATIERVVARVEGRPILLSELRARARPILARLSGAAARAAATRATYRELLAQRIDQELVAVQVESAKISASEREVDDALARIAHDQHLDVSMLLAEALAAGYPEASYRAEIRRQLVEQKWVGAEVARRGSSWPQDPERYATWFEQQRKRLVAELGKRACVERLVRW